jgi:hypothetical protein
MNIIIAGGRNINNWEVVAKAIKKSNFYITQVVSGGATGVDKLGEGFAKLAGLSLKIFQADWNKYGKSAGPIRNKQMAEYADGLIAIWDGKSRGTKNMIDEMKKLGKPVFIELI